VIEKIKKFFLSKLIRSASWLILGGVGSGILGYLFQIIMGRMLNVTEYGVLSALLAMLMIMGAPMTTLTMIISRRVSVFRSQKDDSNLGYLFFWINRKLLLIVFLLAVLILFNMKSLQNFLSIENNVHLYSLLIISLLMFPQAINNAYLQGLGYFKWLSFSGVLYRLLAIIFSITLVYFGLNVTGALGGIIFSTLIVLMVTSFILYPSLKNNKIGTSNATDFLFKSSLAVLFANVAFASMTQMDMVIVKHYFSEQDAGLYASASVLGKAVMYLPSGISMALFPMVAEKHASGKRSSNLIFQAVGLTALLSLAGALLYYFFADYIILLFYGADYREASSILKYFGFAILPMSLIMVAEYFLIAMGRVLFAYLFIVVAPLQLIAVYYYHDTLLNIVMVLFISGAILALSGYGLLWREYKK
jgi:O-antigen/teichoic acid export membrane protein